MPLRILRRSLTSNALISVWRKCRENQEKLRRSFDCVKSLFKRFDLNYDNRSSSSFERSRFARVVGRRRRCMTFIWFLPKSLPVSSPLFHSSPINSNFLILCARCFSEHEQKPTIERNAELCSSSFVFKLMPDVLLMPRKKGKSVERQKKAKLRKLSAQIWITKTTDSMTRHAHNEHARRFAFENGKFSIRRSAAATGNSLCHRSLSINRLYGNWIFIQFVELTRRCVRIVFLSARNRIVEFSLSEFSIPFFFRSAQFSEIEFVGCGSDDTFCPFAKFIVMASNVWNTFRLKLDMTESFSSASNNRQQVVWVSVDDAVEIVCFFVHFALEFWDDNGHSTDFVFYQV